MNTASNWSRWTRWTIATTIGELLGFGVPAIVLPVALAAGLPESAITAPAILAGAGEGAVLGLAQWIALRREFPRVSGRAWVLATALAAMAAYALAMIPTSLVDPSTLDPALLIAGGTLIGLLFVLTMGGAQALVLRGHAGRLWLWVLANAIAWPLGVAMPMIALTSIPDDSTMPVVIVTGIVSGVLMGAVVGALTGAALLRLPHRDNP